MRFIRGFLNSPESHHRELTFLRGCKKVTGMVKHNGGHLVRVALEQCLAQGQFVLVFTLLLCRNVHNGDD